MTHPFSPSEAGTIFRRYQWPVSWITLPDVGAPPFVLGFRLRVLQPQDATSRVFITADERYELYLDGELIARGPERGSPEAWYYAALDVRVTAGEHVLFARVWALGDLAPCAQMTVRPGFLLGVEASSAGVPDARWSTGLAPWEVKRLEGYAWPAQPLDSFTGRRICLDGRLYPWGIEMGEGAGWTEAVINSTAFTAHPTDLFPVRLLTPGTLPQMLRRPVPAGKVRFVEDVSQIEDLAARRIDHHQHLPEVAAGIQALIEGQSTLAIPGGKKYRAIIDLQNYFCARPIVRASQGRDARLIVRWAEALFVDTGSAIHGGSKGNRNEIEGRLFLGAGDTFICDGQPDRDYTTLWWEAGRYLELCIETASEELLLSQFSLEETRYPLEMESGFSVSDERLERLVPLLVRSLQMNAHETFLDCPYYEQLNYTGDTLLDCLVIYAITQDVRLARKSLQLFHDSRIAQGVTQSRFPSRLRQIIPPFSLLWVAMVRQHAWWRGEPELIRSLLPGTRSVIDAHLLHINSDGLLAGLHGWNFLDWVGSWTDGVPPQGDVGQTSGPLNWLFVYVLQAAAELEVYAGDPELAARYVRLAETHARAAEAAFWDESQGLFADDLSHRFFSEHAQCLAILSGHAREEFSGRAGAGLVNSPELQRCTIYFSHYLFETLRKLNQPGPLFGRLEEWYSLASQGFVTTPEMPEPSRSDCHAWGCHPLFHLYGTILGVRPASMGFAQVDIRPQLGPLDYISGRMVHPQGWIEVDLRRDGAKLVGTITLPETVTGTYCVGGAMQPLVPGFQQICV